jgi:hypothetical protein
VNKQTNKQANKQRERERERERERVWRRRLETRKKVKEIVMGLLLITIHNYFLITFLHYLFIYINLLIIINYY